MLRSSMFLWFPTAALACLIAVSPATAQSQRPLIAFGDSITSGFGDDGVVCAEPATFGGYPPRLRSALASRGVQVAMQNHGICGETTAGALSRIDEIIQDARDVGLLVLMEGTNDISAGVGIETISFNLGEMALRGADYRLEAAYASVIPRGPDAGRDANNAIAFGLGELLASRAAAEGRVYIDAFGSLSEIPDVFELLYAETFHPNSEGYDILAEAFVNPVLDAWSRVGQPESGPCAPNPTRLCLNEGRFEVIADWQKPDGQRGVGLAETLTEDTGYFYFFRDSNIELVVKVLDGRTSNGNFWVFYGALSNLEYTLTVRDTVTGIVKRYANPPRTFGSVGDTQAFPVPGAAAASSFRISPGPLPSPATRRNARPIAGRPGTPTEAAAPAVPLKMTVCAEDAETLCLNESRFQVRVVWRKPNGQSGAGNALPRTPDTGMFYFFRESNIELIIKMLDGRGSNGFFWVFYGALSNVEYTITVVDTETGREKTYFNPLRRFASVGDTQAF